MEGMGSAMVLPGGANSLGLTLAGTSTAGKLLSIDGADEASKLTPRWCPKRQGNRVSRYDVSDVVHRLAENSCIYSALPKITFSTDSL